MEQHSVQSAYLKNFVSKGKVWSYNKESKLYVSKAPSKCTIEKDFQPEELEKLQNKEIETIAIRKMRDMAGGQNLSEQEIKVIMHWTALHCIRSKNYRENSGFSYVEDYHSLMNIEKLFLPYYRYVYEYKCTSGDYFITSDNPVIELNVDDFTVRVMAWSPIKAFLFSPKDGLLSHELLSFPMMVNSMHYASCYREIYSHTKELPIIEYMSICEQWGIVQQLEDMVFKIQK